MSKVDKIQSLMAKKQTQVDTGKEKVIGDMVGAQTPIHTSTQEDKSTSVEEQKNTRKQPNKKGNVQETIYITPDKKRKIAVLTALLDKSKGEVLEEGIDYILDKYKHLLRNV
ncbi:MAG: hypothetical protein H6Q69_4978 [Firmicutes bacterium]|nr:hypothetical protein [Bacillota bacterium]